MQSLPRPPETRSLPPKTRMRSERLLPVRRSPCEVPTIATWRPKRLFLHGLADLTPSTWPSGTTLPPVPGCGDGGPTTTMHAPSAFRVEPLGHGACVVCVTVTTHTPRDWSYVAPSGQRAAGAVQSCVASPW